MNTRDRWLVTCAVLAAIYGGFAVWWLSPSTLSQSLPALGISLVFVASVFALLSTVLAAEPDWTTIARIPTKSVVYTLLAILIVGTALQVVPSLHGFPGLSASGSTPVQRYTLSLSPRVTDSVFGALIGGMFTLAGAWFAIRGAFKVQRHTEVSNRIGAGRAVLAELRDNAEVLLIAASTFTGVGPYRPVQQFRTEIWGRHLPLLANLLSWNELELVLTAYNEGSAVFDLAMSIPESRDATLLRLRQEFVDIAKKHLEPMSVLTRTVLNGSDRSRFERKLADFRNRIEKEARMAKLLDSPAQR